MATLLREPEAEQATQRPARITEAEYIRMCDAGVFEPDHVELVRGVLERMAPPGLTHSRAFTPLLAKLWHMYPRDLYWVLGDVRTRLAADFIRAPDIVVARLPIEGNAVPVECVLLAIEVADTSRDYDLTTKAADYAAFGIPNYWVVDALARETHVMSAPGPHGYAQIERVAFNRPLSLPGLDCTIRIDD